MKSLKILIRVDGSHKIGMGHTYRSLNLASHLKNKGHEVVFLTSNPSTKKFIPKKFHCYSLGTFDYNKKLIDNISPNVVVIDKLSEYSQLLQLFKKHNMKVVTIDHTATNKKNIHSQINIQFPPSVKHTNSYSGFKYSILNNYFLESKPIIIRKKVKSILVLQGGSDTRCFIPTIVEALNRVKEEFSITVVVGPMFRCWNDLRKIQKKNRKSLNILQSVKNMSQVMLKHDIAITGAGVSLTELCRVGVPPIIVCAEDFENQTASIMEKKGFGINLGFRTNPSKMEIAKVTSNLINNYSLRKKMNRLGPKIVDGRGIERVAKIIIGVARQN